METVVQSVAVRLQPGVRHALPDASRAEPARLAHEVEVVGRSAVVSALLQSVDATLLVLNKERQIVAVNAPGARGLIGLRPGDALDCANARPPAGCGASAACEYCGALGAILGCQDEGRATEGECLVRGAEAGVARELAVRASPVAIDGSPFTVVTLRDISAEKRCERLEQVFFHDILNTVSGLRGWAWRLSRPEVDRERAAQRIDFLTRQLEREVRDHRSLVLAERSELSLARERVVVSDLLGDLQVLCLGRDAARERRLEVSGGAAAALELDTDPALLTRVLSNMVQNAFEAVPPGATVRVACAPLEPARPGDPPAIRFTVQNEGEIPAEVQPRIFQRSFSTKGSHGRGLGCYGMKLLGERYLGGQVGFTSSAEAGTVFELRLPVRAGR